MERPEGITDELWSAAARMRDAVNLHVSVGNATGERQAGFVAIKLEDGRAVDNVLYDSRPAAVRHTSSRTGIAYIKVGAEIMGMKEATIVLQMFRRAFSNGVVFAEEDPQIPMLTELAMPFLPKTLRRLGAVPMNRQERRHPR